MLKLNSNQCFVPREIVSLGTFYKPQIYNLFTTIVKCGKVKKRKVVCKLGSMFGDMSTHKTKVGSS